MRIDTLSVTNFKGFESRTFKFHPQFNLLVGDNASGKTSALDAAAVAIGSWFLGLPGQDSRHIREEDVRVVTTYGKRLYEVRPQFPVKVEAFGEVGGQNVSWTRTLNGSGGRTTSVGAKTIKEIAGDHQQRVMKGTRVVLPVISYYGAGRLWLEPKDMQKAEKAPGRQAPQDLANDSSEDDADFFAQRLVGYRYSVDDRCSPRDLLRWMRYQRRMEVDEEAESVPYQVVRDAIKTCLRAKQVAIRLRGGTLMAELPESGFVSYSQMSDGYRSMVAMVGDLAYKCAVLNPHLEKTALLETSGVVLIDELDLNLHPNWQRRVIEDLRTIFPKIQFICTTHSPFLIQSLRSGEELLMLEGQPTAQLGNKSLEDIAWGIMGVESPKTSLRYSQMKQVATEYLASLEDAAIEPKDRLEKHLEQLAAGLGPYADNPAFQAFLEFQRIAKLGR